MMARRRSGRHSILRTSVLCGSPSCTLLENDHHGSKNCAEMDAEKTECPFDEAPDARRCPVFGDNIELDAAQKPLQAPEAQEMEVELVYGLSPPEGA